MIEDKETRAKIAENPGEALLHNAITSTRNRIIQQELSLELDRVVLDYLEKKKDK
jgi:hypothetical protein